MGKKNLLYERFKRLTNKILDKKVDVAKEEKPFKRN